MDAGDDTENLKGYYQWSSMAWYSAFNKRVVSGRGASPGEVLVVVLVDLVVAFFLIVSVVALPLLLLLPRKPPPGSHPQDRRKSR